MSSSDETRPLSAYWREGTLSRMMKRLPGLAKLPSDEQERILHHIYSFGASGDGNIGPLTDIDFGPKDMFDRPHDIYDRLHYSADKKTIWTSHHVKNDGSEIRALAVQFLKAEGLSDEEIEEAIIDMGPYKLGEALDMGAYLAAYKERKAKYDALRAAKPGPGATSSTKPADKGPAPSPTGKKKASKPAAGGTSSKPEPSPEPSPPSAGATPTASGPTGPSVSSGPEPSSSTGSASPTEPEAKASRVKSDWSRAKAICSWIGARAPALVVGGLTGAAVRLGLQFTVAAMVTTAPGVVGAIGIAMAMGAVTGGITRLTVTSIFGGAAKKEDKHWKRKALLQGAAWGALGGGLGAGAMQWLMAHDYLPSFMMPHHPAAPTPAPDTPHPPAPGGGAPTGTGASTPVGHSPDVSSTTPHPAPTATVPQETAPSGATTTAVPTDHAPTTMQQGGAPTPHATTPNASVPEASAGGQPNAQTPTSSTASTPVHTEPTAAQTVTQQTPSGTSSAQPVGSARDLLTEEQFKKLPKRIQRLALSKNPKTIALFCGEASYNLMNAPHKTASALKAGAALIERGIKEAQMANLHNSVVEKLHANFAYVKAWGIGTEKDTSVAIEHARQAGTVIHNYGARLLRLLHAPRNG